VDISFTMPWVLRAFARGFCFSSPAPLWWMTVAPRFWRPDRVPESPSAPCPSLRHSSAGGRFVYFLPAVRGLWPRFGAKPKSGLSSHFFPKPNFSARCFSAFFFPERKKIEVVFYNRPTPRANEFQRRSHAQPNCDPPFSEPSNAGLTDPSSCFLRRDISNPQKNLFPRLFGSKLFPQWQKADCAIQSAISRG